MSRLSGIYSFRKLVILSLVTCLFALPAWAEDQQVLDGLAAVVNDDVITFSQVRELVSARENALRETYANQPQVLMDKIKETRLAAVNELIDRQLVLQEFKKNKYSIPDYVLDDHIQTIIREDFKGDRAAFIRTLDAQGYTLNRYREIEEEKIIVQAMQSKQMKTDLIVPPHAVDEYYAKHAEEFSVPEEVKLWMIVLNKNSSTDATQKAMAQEIRQKVKGGAEFGNMAQLYTQDTANPTGDWGWVDRKTLNEQLTKIAFGMKPGEISNVIDSGNNYYILYVEAKRGGGMKSLKEVRADVEKKLLQEQRQDMQQKWIASLRKKAYIKTF